MHIHGHQLFVVTVERRVELAQLLLRGLVFHPHHDAVGLHEITHRHAFRQEFRVRGHAEGNVLAALVQRVLYRLAHPVAGAHRNGGFHHYQQGLHQVAPYFGGHRQHVREIGRAILIRRRTHGDHQYLGVIHRLFHRGGEFQPARLGVVPQHIFQAGLVNGALARLQALDAFLVDVHAQNLVADVRQASAADQSHITAADNRNSHVGSIPWRDLCSAYSTGTGQPDGDKYHGHSGSQRPAALS